MRLINTRSDLDAIAGTAEYDAFINILKGSIYRLEKDDTAKQWVLVADDSTIAKYSFTLVDFADVTPPEVPEYIQKPLAEQSDDVRVALQRVIDIKAQSFGFSGGNALMLYAGFINAFQLLAQTFATWESSVWVEAESYKAQVIAGTAPMLLPEQAIAMMPIYPS